METTRTSLTALFEQLTRTNWSPLVKGRVDPTTAMAIADAFEKAEHAPYCAETREAYRALCQETARQFEKIVEVGYDVQPHLGEGQPYPNSEAMFEDVRHMRIRFFPTRAGHGDGCQELDQTENPMMADSGFRLGEISLCFNDLFRVVHDFFGHAMERNSFGPIGEENAWRCHRRMFSTLAGRALTTETRGQNSWVNFGPHMRSKMTGRLLHEGDPGWLPIATRPYASQKMAILAEEFCGIG